MQNQNQEAEVYLRSLSVTGIQKYDYWIQRFSVDRARHNKTPEIIAEYINGLRSKYRPATLHLIKAALCKSFQLTYAHIYDRSFWHHSRTVFASIKVSVPNRPRPDVFLSEDEVLRMIEHAPTRRHAAVVYLYAVTGCRRAELLKIELKQCRRSTQLDRLTGKRRPVIIIPIIGKGYKAREVTIRPEDFKRIKAALLSKRYLLENIHGRP